MALIGTDSVRADSALAIAVASAGLAVGARRANSTTAVDACLLAVLHAVVAGIDTGVVHTDAALAGVIGAALQAEEAAHDARLILTDIAIPAWIGAGAIAAIGRTAALVHTVRRAHAAEATVAQQVVVARIAVAAGLAVVTARTVLGTAHRRFPTIADAVAAVVTHSVNYHLLVSTLQIIAYLGRNIVTVAPRVTFPIWRTITGRAGTAAIHAGLTAVLQLVVTRRLAEAGVRIVIGGTDRLTSQWIIVAVANIRSKHRVGLCTKKTVVVSVYTLSSEPADILAGNKGVQLRRCTQPLNPKECLAASNAPGLKGEPNDFRAIERLQI